MVSAKCRCCVAITRRVAGVSFYVMLSFFLSVSDTRSETVPAVWGVTPMPNIGGPDGAVARVTVASNVESSSLSDGRAADGIDGLSELLAYPRTLSDCMPTSTRSPRHSPTFAPKPAQRQNRHVTVKALHRADFVGVMSNRGRSSFHPGAME